MTPLRGLLRRFAPFKAKLACGLLITLTSGLLMTAGPVVLQKAVDQLARGTTGLQLSQYAGLVMAIAVLRGLLFFTHERLLLGTSRDVEYRLRNDLYQHLQKLPAAFFQANPAGDLMARVTNDVKAATVGAGAAISHLTSALSAGLFFIPMMCSLSWRLTLLSFLPLPILTALIYSFGKRIRGRFEQVQGQFGVVSSRAQEAISGVRTVRAYAQEQAEVEHFQAANRQYVTYSLKLSRMWAAFDPLAQFFQGLGLIVILWYGGDLTVRGTITVGQLIGFTVYLGYVVSAMHELGWATNLFQQMLGSMGRIQALLSLEPAVRDDICPADIQAVAGDIEFQNLSFTYSGSTQPALCGINLHIPAGQTVALMGTVGSGKSTLMNLIPRLLEAETGRLLIDGRPAGEIPLQALRSSIGYAPQEAFLFSDTIARNIAFGAENASRQKIELAATQAGIAEDIARLPQGYETMVGERGVTLSGGQRQRIALARALIRQPWILILDDALSAVDAQTEEKVLRHLRKLMQGRTCLLSSHRVSALKSANFIAVLKDGRIVEQGTHDELLARGGLYAELHERQRVEETLADGG